MEFKALGQRSTAPTKQLESFPKPKNVTWVNLDCTELTSFCPVTEQPDFSTVDIAYRPKELCLETKSLKLYLWSFREERIFGEGLADRIAQDIFEAIAPEYITVKVTQNVRGGMQLSATAEIE